MVPNQDEGMSMKRAKLIKSGPHVGSTVLGFTCNILVREKPIILNDLDFYKSGSVRAATRR